MFLFFKLRARSARNVSPMRTAVHRVLRRILPPVMEAMEQRRMLTSTCSPGATFLYTGDVNGNTIIASTSGGTLTVTDGTTPCNYTQSSVTSLTIDGAGGVDIITVESSVSVPSITLKGGDGNDVISGGDGGETILGQAGDDVLTGGTGADSIDGGSNDDTLQGDSGADTLVAGSSFAGDKLSYASSTSGISISLDGTVNDTDGFGYTDNIGTGWKTVEGGSAADSIVGSASDDMLLGSDGNDTLRGSAGDGLDGADSLWGGNGTDFADYTLRTDNLLISLDTTANDGRSGASEGDDVRCENVWGGSGADTILGSDGENNFLDGGSGNDSVYGGQGDDTLYGQAGNDQLIGGPDTIPGGSDKDRLYTVGTGSDSLYGGADDDIFDCGSSSDGGDSMYGGTGIDLVDYSGRTAAVTVTIGDNNNNDGQSGEADRIDGNIENINGSGTAGNTITGNASANVLRGGSAGDNIFGGDGDDTIWGGSGVDGLWGENNNDVIYGEGGGDSMRGGAGNDTMYGSTGNDTISGDAGNDSLYGDEDDDLLYGNNSSGDDFTSDRVDGGDGTDTHGSESDNYFNFP
jgi:Ca2+-binding RTX toxin-like protein